MAVSVINPKGAPPCAHSPEVPVPPSLYLRFALFPAQSPTVPLTAAATPDVLQVVADCLVHPLYHALLQVFCVPFLNTEPGVTKLSLFTVKTVMSHPVVCLLKVSASFTSGTHAPVPD